MKFRICSRVRAIPVAMVAFVLTTTALAGTPCECVAQENPADPFAQPERLPGYEDGGRYFVSTEISVQYFIELVARQTNRIFLYDPAELSSQKVFVLAQGARIPEAAYYNLLLAVLKRIGYTITYYGKKSASNIRIYEIVKVENAGHQMHSPGDDEPGGLSETANFVTMVVHLEYADPASVQRALLNLSTRPGGIVQPITGVNAVLISDHEYQIKRMSRLLQRLDQPGPNTDFQVIPVLHADAAGLADTVQRLLARSNDRDSGRPGGTPILIEADPRTNALLVRARPADIQTVRRIVRKLDVEVEDEVTGNLHVYFCRHANAAELAPVLMDAIKSANDDAGGDGNPGNARRQRVSIVADEDTNALLITASAANYLQLRPVLAELDFRKPQVFIEAAILEVSADHNLEYGVELGTLDQPVGDAIRFFGSTQFGLADVVDVDGAPVGRMPKFSDGVMLALNRGDFFSIPALLKATEAVAETNVLSRPHIVTNDNQQATLAFTRGEPTVTSTITQSNENRGFAGYQDAGITFTITPHISTEGADNYLRLKISLEVSNFAARSANASPEAPPPTSKRTIESTVTIPDNATVIIGGLTSTEATRLVKKIPLLADIPVLGELFRFTQTTEKHRNLYIFIRARILRDDDFDDLTAISQQRLDEAESGMGDTMTAMQREFFDRARRVQEGFSHRHVGRSRVRYGYVSMTRDFETRQHSYIQNAEKRRLDAEARAVRQPAGWRDTPSRR